MKISDIFTEIDDQPVGCASLAQVHRGVLLSGEEVAIKIQYPSIKKFTRIDFRNIKVREFLFYKSPSSWRCV